MVKVNEEKIEFARKMYEADNITNSEIAERLKISPNTLTNWIKKYKFTRKENFSEIERVNHLATSLVSYSGSDITLLEMINSLLPRLIGIMNRTLQMYEDKDVPIPLREAGTLLGKLMEIRGKITGETTGDIHSNDTIRSKSIADMNVFANKFPKLLGKKIVGYNDVIDVEQYSVKEIE